MKTDTTYNGWTNYATWRINLEVFDGNEVLQDLSKDCKTVYDLSKQMNEYVSELITENCDNRLAAEYASAFIADCNFYEIAQHYTELLFDIDEAQQ
jgi:hypothetical protein